MKLSVKERIVVVVSVFWFVITHVTTVTHIYHMATLESVLPPMIAIGIIWIRKGKGN